MTSEERERPGKTEATPADLQKARVVKKGAGQMMPTRDRCMMSPLPVLAPSPTRLAGD